MELKEMILEAQKFLGNEFFDSLNISYSKHPDKDYLKVERNNNEVLIEIGRAHV